MSAGPAPLTASDIAKAVTSGKLSALEAVEAALARIERHNGTLNCFTDITASVRE